MKLWLLLFLLSAVLFGAPLLIWWRAVLAGRQKRLIDAVRAGSIPPERTVRPVVLSEQPKTTGLGRFFESAEALPGLSSDSIQQGGWTQSRRIKLTAMAALSGLVIGMALSPRFGFAGPLLGAATAGLLPSMWEARKRRKRLAAIEEEFPEALDCLSRSIRAGNAFSVAIELLADEINEPLKTEIQKVTREMALGSSLEDALNGLIARAPLLEVRFFVSAVLLQRETGGNLAEIMAKLASSLRDRFKLRGHVKAASAQGRLTAVILSALPVIVVIGLHFSTPAYLSMLTDDPIGRYVLVGAAFFQVIGYMVMKKIIKVEV